MLGLPLAFAYPLVLSALILLPVIWYLLRLTPPRPQDEVFPPLAILRKLVKREETPAKSPWWLTLLRLLMAALVIIAMAGPVWNPRENVLRGDGPLLLVIDDGWASGGDWEAMKANALAVIGEAEAGSRLVGLLRTSDPAAMSETPLAPEEARTLLEALPNQPLRPDHAAAAASLRTAIAERRAAEVVFFSDGLDRTEESRELLSVLAGIKDTPITVFRPDLSELVALGPIANEPGRMTGRLVRAETGTALPLAVTGYDSDGLSIARAQPVFDAAGDETDFEFTGPVELRNQIVRVGIERQRSAGAVQLLDDSNRRRVVGLISGQSADISQPLLSPLFYIQRALSPFSDIRDSDTANLDEAASELIEQNVSAIVMADVGTLPAETATRLADWVDEGGMLIRFAGPRLAANPAGTLLPVELVQGDRFIGGALSWETPKSVAPFERGSPFFGLAAPENVAVSRQVLAVQSRTLDERSWARLEDGTPLVTAARRGEGWIVLYHVNSDNNWSNLPLSGTFVEMLRRTVNLSRSSATTPLAEEATRLPPLEILNGEGRLVPPTVETKPLLIDGEREPQVGLGNPPGLYGSKDGYVALNLIQADERLAPLDIAPIAGSAVFANYAGQSSNDFAPILLALAALLFLLDCLAVLWFAGALKWPARQRKTPARATGGLASALLAALLIAGSVGETRAQESAETADEIDYSAALQTRFAYVETGIADVDAVSRAGLRGLTRFVASRTALEPGIPVAIDIATDELAFYPFLYWPVHPDAPVPDEAVMARADAYMKQGGTILFDTRDQISGILNNDGGSAETFQLREMLANLDIPPLEPVPPDHVLTKAFFLLDSFPGRYQGGDLWVEQIGTAEEDAGRPARAGDGVSTILITGNDFAGAWAVDDNNRALFPTVPPNPMQREYAFRVGVNIVMYTMTGNYKADQVHVPALLERLGQ